MEPNAEHRGSSGAVDGDEVVGISNAPPTAASALAQTGSPPKAPAARKPVKAVPKPVKAKTPVKATKKGATTTIQQKRKSNLPQAPGSEGQCKAASALFDAFLAQRRPTWAGAQTWDGLLGAFKVKKDAERTSGEPAHDFIYMILKEWVLFLYNYKSKRAKNHLGVLSQSTADNYLSQIKCLFEESCVGLLGDKPCKQIRSSLVSMFHERAVKEQICQKQAPAMTVNDMVVLGKMLYAKGDKKSTHVACTLVILWHMLGRAINSSWLWRQQLSVVCGGELVVNFARVKTPSLQGVSLYPHRSDPHLCPFLALAVLLVTSGPSKVCIELAPVSARFVGAISQDEAQEVGIPDDVDDEDDEEYKVQVAKAPRKRPSIAQLINIELKKLNAEYEAAGAISELGLVRLTRALELHSIRLGAAQWAGSSPKINMQWICSRGHRSADALSKAFAYIGTTLPVDQKIAKRLAGWEPDDDVAPLTLAPVKAELPEDEQALLAKFQTCLFVNAHGFEGESEHYNVADEVCNTLFAALLLHLEYVYHLQRSSAFSWAVDEALKNSGCSMSLLEKAGTILKTAFAVNLKQHECTKCDAASAIRELRSTYSRLETKVDRIESKIDRLLRILQGTSALPVASAAVPDEVAPGDPATPVAMYYASFNTTIGQFVYKWYAEEMWKSQPTTKAEQTKRSQIKSTMAIIKLVAQHPFCISAPSAQRGSAEDYNSWKTNLDDLSKTLEAKVVANMSGLDRGSSRAASSLRTRLDSIATTNKTPLLAMIAKTKNMLDKRTLLDDVTPQDFDGLAACLKKYA